LRKKREGDKGGLEGDEEVGGSKDDYQSLVVLQVSPDG